MINSYCSQRISDNDDDNDHNERERAKKPQEIQYNHYHQVENTMNSKNLSKAQMKFGEMSLKSNVRETN